MFRISTLNFIKIMSAGIFLVVYTPKYGKIVEDEGEKCQKEKKKADVHLAIIALKNRFLYKKQKRFKTFVLINICHFILRKKNHLCKSIFFMKVLNYNCDNFVRYDRWNRRGRRLGNSAGFR